MLTFSKEFSTLKGPNRGISCRCCRKRLCEGKEERPLRGRGEVGAGSSELHIDGQKTTNNAFLARNLGLVRHATQPRKTHLRHSPFMRRIVKTLKSGLPPRMQIRGKRS